MRTHTCILIDACLCICTCTCTHVPRWEVADASPALAAVGRCMCTQFCILCTYTYTLICVYVFYTYVDRHLNILTSILQYLIIGISISISINSSINPSFYRSILSIAYLSMYLSTYLSTYLSIYLSIYLCTYIYMYTVYTYIQIYADRYMSTNKYKGTSVRAARCQGSSRPRTSSTRTGGDPFWSPVEVRHSVRRDVLESTLPPTTKATCFVGYLQFLYKAL